MKLLKNFLMTLMMIYAFVTIQVMATEGKKEELNSSQIKQTMTSQQNEETTLKKEAIKFYAQNYGVINLVTVVVPIAAYGIYRLVNYIDESQQQQRAWYKEQRVQYVNNCMLIAKDCNGTWISTEQCQASLAESTCYNLLFDCVSKLCGWELLFVSSPDNKSAKLLVNAGKFGNANTCS